jgi:Flp pilus assembly protein protease CpaA
MTTTNGKVHVHSPELAEASLGQLTARMSEQVSRLVRDELALAQVEAKQKAKRLGVGFGMFGAGGMLAFFGAAVAVAAAVLGLANVVPAWLAALIVAGGLFALGGLVALSGKKAVSEGTPPVPKQAIESSKEDVAALRQAVHR